MCQLVPHVVTHQLDTGLSTEGRLPPARHLCPGVRHCQDAAGEPDGWTSPDGGGRQGRRCQTKHRMKVGGIWWKFGGVWGNVGRNWREIGRGELGKFVGIWGNVGGMFGESWGKLGESWGEGVGGRS